MLNTYHVSVELTSRDGAHLNDSFCAVVVTAANREEEAADAVANFFGAHEIDARVVHAWEVA